MNRAASLFPIRRSAVALALLFALSVACARKPDDAKISSEVQSKFSQDSGLGAKHLTVDSTNGVVTLSGTVDNAAQRDAASRQAAAVSGVKEVVNDLQIGDAPASSAMRASSTPPDSTPAAAPASAPAKPTASVKATPTKKPRKSNDSAPPADSASNNDSDSNASPAADNTPPPSNAAPDNTPVATQPPPPPAPKHLIVDQGTQVTVRLIDPIDSEKNQTGDTFRATLNAPLTSDGEEAVPAGVELTGHLVERQERRQVRRTVAGRPATRQHQVRWPDLHRSDRPVQKAGQFARQEHRRKSWRRRNPRWHHRSHRRRRQRRGHRLSRRSRRRRRRASRNQRPTNQAPLGNRPQLHAASPGHSSAVVQARRRPPQTRKLATVETFLATSLRPAQESGKKADIWSAMWWATLNNAPEHVLAHGCQ